MRDMKRGPESHTRLTLPAIPSRIPNLRDGIRDAGRAGHPNGTLDSAAPALFQGIRGRRHPQRAAALCIAIACIFAVPLALAAQDIPPPKGTVLDEIVAHVNDDIITSNQYNQAKQAVLDGIKQDCPSCTPEQIQTKYQQQMKSLLGQMISNDLLVQTAKQQGINVDADVVKELDQERQKYHLDSIDALRREVEASGMNWDDYQDQIRRQDLASQVVQQDVGGMVQIDPKEVRKYYDAHKQEFNGPETVEIRDIFLSTQGKNPAQIAAIKKQAEALHQRVLDGQDFAKLAKLYSQDRAAQQGGELGVFQRGQLRPVIDQAVFALQRNGVTPVLDIGNGFDIIQVERHTVAGIQPLDAVEPEIENAIYRQKVGPVLQTFLKQLREQAYILIAPGYTDDLAVPETAIQEVTPGADTTSGKKAKKKAAPAGPGVGDPE